jgi:predicted HTH transcriptional regulator
MSKSFFIKEEYNENDLNYLIQNGIEESLNLDYKSARSLDKTDGKKAELAKDISAFANSNGGIIIYGIEEQDHKPTEFSFVDGNFLNKEWLENVIDSKIHPRIQSVIIYPIRIKNQLTNTIYLVKIPESLNGPHMSTDKKYYRRYNFKSVPMEEYEIRNMYNRNSYAEMDFKSVWSNELEDTVEDDILSIRKEIFIHIENIGQSLEKHCKIEASLTGVENLRVGLTYYRESNVGQRMSSEKTKILTAYNETPIFPSEEISILRFELKVAKDDLEDFKQNAMLELTLFDSSTIKTIEYDFVELMKRKKE